MSTNAKITLLAFAVVLIAFACGITYSSWISGREPNPWLFTVPFVPLAVSFGVPLILVWARKAWRLVCSVSGRSEQNIRTGLSPSALSASTRPGPRPNMAPLRGWGLQLSIA
jgi:hypothetical protein